MSILPAFLALATLSTPRLSATRTDKPPVLDGRLDDAVWQKANATDAFTQKQPEGGKPPAERTKVRILYDKDALYIGFECEQRRSKVIGRLTRRDRDVEADMVSVILDSRSDGKTAFEFAANAAGVVMDGLHFNDTEFSIDWDEIWEAKTAVSPHGWSAEFRIPLRILRFSARAVQSFGLQLRRYTSVTRELDEWAYTPRDVAAEVSRYGRLEGLEGLTTTSPFEVRPFIAGRLHHYDPDSSNLARGFKPFFSAGTDLKWHISQDLTLDATFLPDFGQVEADQVVLNLTTFEQYLPEKRPFFLEGTETFNTPVQLLYTRRIGRAPESPTLRDNEALARDPAPAEIYGAAKLVGHLGGHFSVGELVALTGRQTLSVREANGKDVERLIDPLTTYKVLRLKRELGDRAHVGVMAMATNRLEAPSLAPILRDPGAPSRMLCPGGEEVAPGARCFHDSYVGSVDGRWRSPSGDYAITAQALATLIKNGPDRSLLDGTVIRSGDIGPAAFVSAAKEGGAFTFRAEYEGHGRKVDYNDLGFMDRQNTHRVFAEVGLHTLEPRGPTLETHTLLDYGETDDLDLLNQWRSVWLNNFTRFKNFWELFTELHVHPTHYDDREIGDGAALERPALFGVIASFGTDTRKRVSLSAWNMLRFIDHQALSFQGNGTLSFRILPQFDVDLLPTWLYTKGERRWVETRCTTGLDDCPLSDSFYVFGRLRAQSFGLTLRSTYTFTPELTLQAYAQLFLSAGHYSDITSAPARARAAVVHLAEMKTYTGPLEDNPDFESSALNASLVLRWEYRLGSTLYFVYSHAQSSDITPVRGEGAGFDFRRAAPHAASDDFLLKLSYWWGGG